MKNYELDDIISIVERIVSDKPPGYVDPSAKAAHEEDDSVAQSDGCRYFSGGETRCIVGELFHRIGVADSYLEEFDKQGISAASATDVVEEALGVSFDQAATTFLQELQGLQDAVFPWDKALEQVKSWWFEGLRG